MTFSQPYAVQTALLLNDAIIVDRRVRILPLENVTSVRIINCTSENINIERDGGGFVPATRSAVQAVAVRGQEALSKAKEQALDTGRTLAQKANSTISIAEQTAGGIGSAVVSSDCFSKGALWLSGILDRASKTVAELGNVKGKNTTSRKQR